MTIKEDEMVSGLGSLETRVGNLEKGLAENTAATKRIDTSTSELVEFFSSVKGAFKVLEILGKAAKPLAAIAGLGAAAALWWTSVKVFFR